VKELNFAVGAVSILEVYGLLLAAAIVAGVAIVWILPGRAGAIAAMLPRASLPPHMGRKRQRRSEPQIADMPSHVIGRARSAFIGVGAFSLIINLLMLTTSLYMMQIFDRVLSGQSRQTLLYLSIIAIMAVAMLGTLDLIRSRILSRIGSWVERSLSCAVYLKGLDNALIGRPYRTEALRDLGAVRSFLSTAGILALFDAPWVPVYLGMVYLLNPLLGHIALVGAILLVGLAYATDRFTAGILKQAKVASGAGLRHAESTFRNAEVIHGMGMGQALAKLWQGLNKEAIALGEAASDRGGMISASSKFLRLALQIVVPRSRCRAGPRPPAHRRRDDRGVDHHGARSGSRRAVGRHLETHRCGAQCLAAPVRAAAPATASRPGNHLAAAHRPSDHRGSDLLSAGLHRAGAARPHAGGAARRSARHNRTVGCRKIHPRTIDRRPGATASGRDQA
jgi:hypothetical protein